MGNKEEDYRYSSSDEYPTALEEPELEVGEEVMLKTVLECLELKIKCCNCAIFCGFYFKQNFFINFE